MKSKKLLLLSIFWFLLSTSVYAGISNVRVWLSDSSGNTRTNFSSNETITLNVECYNGTVVPMIYFKFSITDPLGIKVFEHTGNAAVGKVGTGGSSLRNVPLKNYYTNPGYYTYKAEVTDGVQTVQQSLTFNILSPIITLTYPANGARDLIDQPLTFRWVASGATKYKVYVDDDASFYNTIWTGETTITFIQYPVTPADPLQRLQAGTIYYWKVEGLDANGNMIATTPVPFTFTVKSQVTSRDLTILTILFDKTSSANAVKMNVVVKNQGNQAESDIEVTLFVAGVQIFPAQRISFINVGETQVLTFDCGTQKPGPTPVQATINFFDDNPKNNTYSATINIMVKEEAASISGRVMDALAKGINDALVKYSGPLSGSVLTKNGGQYRVADLEIGEYIISITHPKYKDSDTKTVRVETKKAYPNIDFVLQPIEVEIVKKKGRILGSVKDDSSPAKKILGAIVTYSGVMEGMVMTNEGGEYKIEDLVNGDYLLKVSHPDYEDAVELTVKVEKEKAYPNIDFILKAKVKVEEKVKEEVEEKKEEVEEVEKAEEEEVKKEEKKEEKVAELSLDEIWSIVGEEVGKLGNGKEILGQLEGYRLESVEVLPSGEAEDIIRQMKENKIKVIEASVEIIP